MHYRQIDNNFNRQDCVYGASCYQKNPEHLAKFSHPGEDPALGAANNAPPVLGTQAMVMAQSSTPTEWTPGAAGTVALRPGLPPPVAPPVTPASSNSTLYGMTESQALVVQGMVDYPVAEPVREPTPPPHVNPLPGYLEESPGIMKETDALVFASGARRDASGVLGIGLPKLTAEQALLIQRAKKYAMEVSIKMVLMKQTLAQQQQQTKYLQRQQAVSIMSRIYVGSINYDTKEDAIKTAFLPFGPVRGITMSWDSMTGQHKGFAFVEFEQPEAAQLALDQMNGILVCGKNIKVGRPSQMPQAQAVIDEVIAESKTYNRIYVASIHKDLTDDDIRSVFSAFGVIKFCELASAGVPGRHKGYGYIEYETALSTHEAISSMNLFDLGGQYLRVGRAITPPEARNQALAGILPSALPSASAVAGAAATAKIQAMDAVAANLGVDPTRLHVPGPTPQIKKCGLPRDAEGRPIKAMSQLTGKPPVPPHGDRSRSRDISPRRSRDRSRSPRRNRRFDRVADAAAAIAAAVKKDEDAIARPLPPVPLIPVEAFHQPMAPPEPQPSSTKVERKGVAQETARDLQKDLKLPDEGEPVTLRQQEDMSIKGKSARHMVMQRLMGARGKVDSKVLLLKNMVGHDDVDEELQDEIEAECSKYGKVENVIIYQEKQDESDDAEIHVKIFVEFEEDLGAKKAKNALDGRFFGGRTVLALIYDQEMYDQQDFSA